MDLNKNMQLKQKAFQIQASRGAVLEKQIEKLLEELKEQSSNAESFDEDAARILNV